MVEKMTEKTVDARGLLCPKPVIMTKRALAEMGAGRLTVIVDNPTAVANIRAYAESLNLSVESREESGSFYVSLEKGAEDACSPVPESAVVVLINDNKFGGGDEEFGKTLLKNFIFALTEATPKPATMLFVNAGVYFTVENSPVLESLCQLEEAGVEILTCGACLDFYQLKDSLAIGGVTNMYTIAEKLLRASQVVKP